MKNLFCEKIEDSSKIWLTSDTHFWHNNIIRYCNRPFATVEEMNEALIKNWNSVIGPDDIVYHLGDFCFGSVDKWNTVLAPGVLNGHIHLILGNHDPDRVFRDGTMRERFEEIDFQKYLMIDGWGVYLNHFPFLDFSNNIDHKVIQLHGHIHSGLNNTGTINNERFNMLKWNQYDVGVDNNNYTPVAWSEVLKKIKLRVDEHEKA
jgi:calcineurin-like phosphoesterase family protein